MMANHCDSLGPLTSIFPGGAEELDELDPVMYLRPELGLLTTNGGDRWRRWR
jgi:hypothetical protein